MHAGGDRGLASDEIAEYLGCIHEGKVRHVIEPSSVGSAKAFSLVFLLGSRRELVEALREVSDVTVITDVSGGVLPHASVIKSSNPRLDFARAVANFFAESSAPGIHPTAIISPRAHVGHNVSIGPYACIDEDVTIGDFAVIGSHTVIRRGTQIGNRANIKCNSVIGEQGFGFEYDETGRPIRIPHLGAVRIGNDVEIGALVVVARGTLDDTVVGDSVKIDDHVFIAHNVSIGDSAVVIAGAEVSGSTKIGRGAWIGPQATIREQTEIGEGALVGIGAVVVSDVAARAIVAGNPARFLRVRD